MKIMTRTVLIMMIWIQNGYQQINTLLIRMMEELREHIGQLRNAVYLKYVDPLRREQTLNILDVMKLDNNNATVCQEYIATIEQCHQKMMSDVSHFLDLLTPAINEHTQHFENMHQQLTDNATMHRHELQQLHNRLSNANLKLQNVSIQLHEKDQEIRELNSKLEDKEAMIEIREKQQREHLTKMEIQFQKQQKALEQSYLMINQLREEIQQLHAEISALNQMKNNDIPSDTIAVTEERVGQTSRKHHSSLTQKQDDSCLRVLCSSHSEGVSQYQEVKLYDHTQQKIERQEGERPEILRQLLSVSVEKQYKLAYNKYDSGEPNQWKQNWPSNWVKSSKRKSDQKKETYIINQSQQMVDQSQHHKNIQEFKMSQSAPMAEQNNPYYHFFLITSQNIKIRSKYFQELISIPTEREWVRLRSMRIPLHQWQAEIQKYLLTQCNIIN